MAHHQGMALCAIANALTGGVLERTFEKDPRVRAIEPLLEEKIPKMKRTKRLRARVEPDYVPTARGDRYSARAGRAEGQTMGRF